MTENHTPEKQPAPLDIIVPRPTSRHRESSQSLNLKRPAQVPVVEEAETECPILPSLNPMVSLASRIISAAYCLKRSEAPVDIPKVLNRFQGDLQQFQQAAVEAGYDRKETVLAHYLLCAFIDDAAMSTPWGLISEWVQGGVLVRFATLSDRHQRNLPGQDFFEVIDVLDGLITQSSNAVDLLELCYLLLSLGFKGRFSLLGAEGERQLQQIQATLYAHIEKYRGSIGEVATFLSASYQPFAMKANSGRRVPIWVVFSVSCCILLLIYFGLLLALNRASDPLVLRVNALENTVESFSPAPISNDATLPVISLDAIDLATYLTDQLPELLSRKAFLVELREGREAIVLQGDDFFSSGSVEVNTSGAAVIAALANSLQPLNARWEIRGHTDDLAIRSIQYPSNWYLAKARASAVQALLIPVLGADSVAEVRSFGEYEPIVANDSKENRAKNRRVELVKLD